MRISKELIQQILRFGVAGTIGFVVDGGLLFLLVSLGIDHFIARAISFPIAIITTWYINREWTFSYSHKDSPKKQLSNYIAVQLTGAAGNYLIYAVILNILNINRTIVMFAFAVGSFCGMFINFIGSRFYVFNRKLSQK